MATKEAIFRVEIDSKDAVKDIKQLDKDMTHLRDTIGVDVSGSISALEDKLYELALAGQQNTKEFKDLVEQTARYRKIIIQTDKSVDKLAEQGRGLGTALQLAEGTVAGFQAFTGVTALLGDENEELLETITKLQAAQGVLNSIEVIKQQLQGKSITLTNAQTFAQKLLTRAIGNGTKASKLLRGALLATGIGALIVGVGLLIANFDKLKNLLTLTSQRQKDLNASQEEYNNAAKEAIKQTTEVGAAFHLAKDGVISKEEALKIYNETLGDSLGAAEDIEEAEKNYVDKTEAYIKATGLRAKANKLLELAAEEQAKATLASLEDNRSFTEKTLGFITKATAVAVDNVTAGFTNFSEKSAQFNKDVEKRAEERTKIESKARAEQLTNLSNDLIKQAKAVEETNGIMGDSEAKLAEERAKRAEEERKRNEQFLKDRLAAARQSQDLELELLADGAFKEIELNRVKYERLIQDTISNQKLLQEEKETIIARFEDIRAMNERNIRDKYLIEEAEFLNKLQDQRESLPPPEFIDPDFIAGSIDASIEEFSRMDEFLFSFRQRWSEDFRGVIDGMTEAQSDALSRIQGLSDAIFEARLARAKKGSAEEERIARKNFDINKKLQIAQALIQAPQAILAAYSSGVAVPIVGPALGPIYAATAAATTAAQIAKIKASKFEGGGGASAQVPSGGGVGASAGSFSISDNISTDQTQLSPTGQPIGQNGVTKVIVTETDISEVQNGVAAIDARSTF